MRLSVSVCMSIAALGLFPWRCEAQMSTKSLSTRRPPTAASKELLVAAGTPTDAASEEDCHYFIDAKFHKTTAADFAVASGPRDHLESCTDGLAATIAGPVVSGLSVEDQLKKFKEHYKLTTKDQTDEQLSTTHYLARVLRRWAVDGRTTSEQASTPLKDILTELDAIDASLHTLMKAEGLLEKFAGALVAGPAFGDTGKLSPGTTTVGGTPTTTTTGTAATSSQSTTGGLAHVEWGSQHFGDESWSPVDFSFGGAFGLQPQLSLLTNPPAAGSAPSSAATTSQYQSAFVWSLNGRGNLHTGSSAETTAYWKSGQVRLLTGNGATVIDQGANSTLQIPLNGNADRMAWFHEGGVEFNYYNKALEVIHAEKGQLDPTFNIALGYKWDTRFKASNGVVGFDSPDRRLVFRFMINGLKILDKRPNTTASKPYSVSFGIEHERGFGNNPAPSGTLIIIRGDIELLKIINPGSGT